MRDAFLEGMSRAATTVSVITTDGPAGRAGLTVSAMCPVSADTPTPALLVCVNHSAAAAEAIQENGVFCVNVLRADQVVVADTFAGRVRTASGDKFECGVWRTLGTGAPVLDAPLVAFDCRMTMRLRYGTHWIFIGELDAVELPATGLPLVYANRAYNHPVRLAASRSEPRGARGLTIAALPELAAGVLPELLAGFLPAHPDVGVEILEGTRAELLEALAIGTADLALAYDLDLGDDVERAPLGAAQLSVLLPPGDRRAGAPLSPADLAGTPLVLLDRPGERDVVAELFAAAGVTPEIAWRVPSQAMAAGLVAQGLGTAVLLGPALAAAGDHARLTGPTPPVVLAHSRGAPLQAAAGAFLAHCRATLAPG